MNPQLRFFVRFHPDGLDYLGYKEWWGTIPYERKLCSNFTRILLRRKFIRKRRLMSPSTRRATMQIRIIIDRRARRIRFSIA
jgi:hypothetical protein